MSEETKPVEQTEEEQQGDLLELLTQLVPPDTIEILDIFGNSYKKPSVLSARKQIKVVREFEKAISYISEQDFKPFHVMSLCPQLCEHFSYGGLPHSLATY